MLNGLGMYEVLVILIASLFLIDIKKVAKLIKWFRDMKVKMSNFQRDIEDQISDHLSEVEAPQNQSIGAEAMALPTQTELPSPVLLESEEKATLDTQLQHQLSMWHTWMSADVIGGYMPLKNEPDLVPLYKELLTAGKELYLPRVDDDESVRFVLVSNMDDLENGPFGRLQPKKPEYERPFQKTLDFILIPGIFFTENFMRIGHRRDFYANLLSVTQPTQRVGVGFHQQLIENHTHNDNPMHLDVLITNTNVAVKNSQL